MHRKTEREGHSGDKNTRRERDRDRDRDRQSCAGLLLGPYPCQLTSKPNVQIRPAAPSIFLITDEGFDLQYSRQIFPLPSSPTIAQHSLCQIRVSLNNNYIFFPARELSNARKWVPSSCSSFSFHTFSPPSAFLLRTTGTLLAAQ